MPYATFDQTHYPFIIISFTGEKATSENFQGYLAETRRLYDNEENIGILFDATQAKFPGLTYQKMQANWLKDNEGLMRNYCVGVAYNIPNTIIRSALDLIFKIQDQPVPFKVFSNNSEALTWLKSCYQDKK